MENKNKLSLIVPSRGRPRRLEKFLNSLSVTCSNTNNFEVIINLDKDDQENYKSINTHNIKCRIIFGKPGRTMGELNCSSIIKAKFNNIFLLNDDVIFKTDKWDEIILNKINELNSNIFLLYPNDGLKKKKLATFPIFDKTVFDKFPNFLPDNYLGAFIDLHILDIFMEYKNGKNIFYLANVICQHLHFRIDSNLYDETYHNRRRFDDDALFVRLSNVRKQIAINFEDSTSIILNNFKSNYFNLLRGNSSILWRLKLFFYLSARYIYYECIFYFNKNILNSNKK